MTTYERTRCSGGDCVEIGARGDDWFVIRSSAHTRSVIAVSGDELRAFLRQVRCGQFDELAGLEPDTTVTDLQNENAALREQVRA